MTSLDNMKLPEHSLPTPEGGKSKSNTFLGQEQKSQKRGQRTWGLIWLAHASIFSSEGEVEITVEDRSPVQILHLGGDLKSGEPVAQFQKVTDELLASGKSLFVIDLAETRIMDSSGIGALMKLLASVSVAKGTVKLANPSEFTLRTLKLVGLLKLFEVFDDANLAAAACKPAN